MVDSLRLSGLATGLDTSSLISQLMNIERRPIRLMESTQKLAQSRIDMYRVINTKLVALQRAAEKVQGLNFSAGNAGSAASAMALTAGILNPTLSGAATAGTYNFNVISLARAQITGGGGFSVPASTRTITNSDPTRFTATVGAATPVGTYSIDVQSLAQVQKNSGGAFAVPGTTTSVDDPSIYTATATSAVAPGTYGIEVTRMATNQVSGGGAFTQPTITATSGNPASYTVAVTGTPASQTPTVQVNNLVQQQVYRSGNSFSDPGNRILTITNSTTGTSVDIAFVNGLHDTQAQVAARINEFTGSTGVSVTVAAGRMTLTGSNGDAFTFSNTAAARLDLTAGTGGSVTTTAQKASITVGGTTYTNGTNDFTAPIAGVTITAVAAAAASTLTINNQSGSIRFTDDTGAFTDVAIAAGDDINAVVGKINGGGTGMTATTDGTTITLTGDTVGKSFTIGDAPGTTGLAAQLGITPLVQDARAAIEIDGTEYTSNSNTFTNPIAGLTVNANQLGTSDLNVYAGGGTLRIWDDAAGTFTDIAIAEGANLTTVRNAINAAGSGMTAAINGTALELTGNTVGQTFTVEDAGGGNALATSLGIATISQTASLASLSINGGAAVTSTTNTFNSPGALTGTTINALATGTSTLKVAEIAGTLRITNDSTGTFKDIDIEAGWDVNQVRNAINASGSGMTATTDGATLTLTGSSGIDFTVADSNGGNTLAQSLGIDSVSRTTQTAQQAQITVDGGAVQTSNTNTFTNAIPGLNVTATSVGTTDVEVKEAVAATAGTSPTEAVKDMIAKLNDVLGYIKENSSYNATTKKAGALLSDSTVTSLRINLTRMATGMVDDGSAYYNGQTAGMTLQRDGTISFDEAKFQSAIAADATAVQNLFTREDGVTFTGVASETVKSITLGRTGLAGDGIANRLAGFVEKMVSGSSQYNTIDPSRGLRSVGALLGAIQNNELTISTLDKRIEEYEIRLKEKERGLMAKFQAMEKSVAMLRNNGNYFTSQLLSLNSQLKQ